MHLIRHADLAAVPWKNGTGVTREIAAERAGTALLWRLSVADVAGDGAFSQFTGLTRVLTVIEGNGMDLTGPGTVLRADVDRPVRFDGATPIMARLRNGPLRDFNLIFDPNYCDGDVAVLRGPCHRELQGDIGLVLALHALQGGVMFGTEHLQAGDTMLVGPSHGAVILAEGAKALLVSLTIVVGVGPSIQGS